MASLINERYNFAIRLSESSQWYYFKAKEIHEGWESLASEDSGRTLDGVMHIYWVKRKLRKVEITLPPCNSSTINSIVNKVQGQEYYLRYYSANGGDTTIHCYTSNAGADMYSGVIRNGLWEGFEFHAIEIGD